MASAAIRVARVYENYEHLDVEPLKQSLAMMGEAMKAYYRYAIDEEMPSSSAIDA